jgi:hypothetical protein
MECLLWGATNGARGEEVLPRGRVDELLLHLRLMLLRSASSSMEDPSQITGREGAPTEVPADREHVGPGSQARDVTKQEESDDMWRATHSSAVGPTRLWLCRQNAERGRTTGWSVALTRF